MLKEGFNPGVLVVFIFCRWQPNNPEVLDCLFTVFVQGIRATASNKVMIIEVEANQVIQKSSCIGFTHGFNFLLNPSGCHS